MDISVTRIAKAYEQIDSVFKNSPQFISDALGAVLGKRVLLKVEVVNPIRSFKGRGSSFLLRQFKDGQHLVCPSAGNFGQALAYCAASTGVRLTVVAPETANPLKVEAMRRLGAKVLLQGHDFDEAKKQALSLAQREDVYFVEDGKDLSIAEGAGTIGLELLRANKNLDAVFVPVGNGSLICGIAAWIKAHSPNTRVIGVCPVGAPSMALSFHEDRIVNTETADTIADGLAVRIPVPEAVAFMRNFVDDVVLVSDDNMIEAMRLAFQYLGLALEPSGAAGLAGIMTTASSLVNAETVATVLCGGNVRSEHLKYLGS